MSFLPSQSQESRVDNPDRIIHVHVMSMQEEYFSRAHLYRDLRMSPGRTVREARADERTFSYSERHLQCVWFDSAWRPENLRSADGEEVMVEDPGRWNLEAGPDFLDAVLRVGPERRRIEGDVEVHIRPAEWQGHDHSNDPGYARVIAHVTYFPGLPAACDTSRTLSTMSKHLPPGATEIFLRDALKADPSFCFESIDVTAYPYATLPGTTPACAKILASWPPEDRNALLEAAGEERLRMKADRMIDGIEEWGKDQLFYEEIMCSLGYKHNRAPFRQLARLLTLETVREEAGHDVIKAYSLLLGSAGLLPVKSSTRWESETRSFVRLLWDNWWKQRSRREHSIMSKATWRLSGIRPQNHPVRRLAAASAVFTRKKSLLSQLAALDTANPQSWLRKAESIIQQAAAMDYWDRRLSFSGKKRNSDLALIGSRRIAAMLSNVVIPFLAATGVPVTPLLSHLPPEQDNSLIRHTAFALFGRDYNPALHRKGLRQQGLLQIFHDFCINNKTACRACPLPRSLGP